LTGGQRQDGKATASFHFAVQGEDAGRAATGDLIRPRQAPNRFRQLAPARSMFDAKKRHNGIGPCRSELLEGLMNRFLSRG
jgi:hypothetical protein